jgi:hypothetical protein
MTQLSPNLLSYQQLLIKVDRLINVVNSRGIFSKEEIASEYSKILTEVQQQMGAPLTQYDPFIKGEPPISSKVNLFFEGSASDINIAAGQIDSLNAKSISVFNLFTKEIENEKRFSERIASKAKILQMYSRSPADDIFYVGDSFDNDDSIDYSKIQAGFNPLIKNGIMSLSVSATQKWNANLVKILSSGGFIGNSHQVVKSLDAEQSSDYKYVFENSSTLNNLTSIKDSNPLSYFEYEALNVDKNNPSPKPSIPARQNEFKYLKSEFSSSKTGEGDLVDWSNHQVNEPLVLDLELASSSSAVANSIDITPYFGSMKYVEVSSVIVYGKDGVSEQILKSPIYIGSSLVPLNLQMAKSYFYDKATIRFSERQVFKIQVSFTQPEYSNIDIQHLYWKPTASNRNNPFVNLERFNPDALSKDIYEKVEYNKYNLLPTQSNPTEYSRLGSAAKTINVSIKKKPVARKFYVIELTLTSPLNVQEKVYFERWDSEFELGTGNVIKTAYFLSSIEYSEDEIKNKNYDTMNAAQKDFDDLMDLYMSHTALVPAGTTFTATGTSITKSALVQGATTFTASGTSVTAEATYIARSQSATSGTGTGAVFNIVKTGSGTAYSGNITVTITNGGSNYAVGDTITILGTNLGGATPANDLTLTVATRATAYPGVMQSATSGTGTNAIFTITKTGSSASYSGNTTVTMTQYGTGYAIGDTITIPGTSLGGTVPENNLTLTVTNIGPTLLDDGSTVNSMSVVEKSFTAQERIKTYSVRVQSAKERYPAKRWCIGLRDIEVYKEIFNSQLEIVSLPFNFDFPVESAMLSIDSNIDEAMLKNISLLGYISVDGGNNWIQISPIQLDFSGIPEVLFFNQSVLNEYRLSGASYLTYPAVPREVRNILVKIKITKKNKLNFTPSIYSYQLIAKVKRS